MGMTDWYSVHVQARAPESAPRTVTYDAAADRLMDMLTEYDGVVSSDESQWGVTISLEEPDPTRAAAVAAALVESLAATAGMPSWPFVRVEAVREDVLREDNAQPTLPGLVSAPEAADILGVSAQRIRELAAAGQGFPDPVYELKAGKLWLQEAIQAYAKRRDRKPGRPDRARLVRRRATTALLDAGITVSDMKVFLGSERAVVVQLAPHGSPQARRRTAARAIVALGSAGLGVTAEESQSADDADDPDDMEGYLEGYLAGGHAAEVFDLDQQQLAAQRV